jgi:hypothetical protein
MNALGRQQNQFQPTFPPHQQQPSFPSQQFGQFTSGSAANPGLLSPFGQICLPPPPATKAFDDLLPKSNPKVSMNDMMTKNVAPPAPIAPVLAYNAPPKPAANALSSKDIDDLLS